MYLVFDRMITKLFSCIHGIALSPGRSVQRNLSANSFSEKQYGYGLQAVPVAA